MKPDANKHNPEPAYLRRLIERAGQSQRGAARLVGVPERTMRDFLSVAKTNSKAPYAVQFALECLADAKINKNDIARMPISGLSWDKPVSRKPAGWLERQALIGNDYFLSVRLSVRHVFEYVILRFDDGKIWRGDLQAVELEAACFEAEQVFNILFEAMAKKAKRVENIKKSNLAGEKIKKSDMLEKILSSGMTNSEFERTLGKSLFKEPVFRRLDT